MYVNEYTKLVYLKTYNIWHILEYISKSLRQLNILICLKITLILLEINQSFILNYSNSGHTYNHWKNKRQTLVFIWNSALREKFNFSYFILASNEKMFMLTLTWALVYNSSKFWDFPDISIFPKILSFKSFGNSWSISHTPCLLLIITLCFTSGERKSW